MVSAKSLCRDITCESVPGSPPPFYFSPGRGESLGTRLHADDVKGRDEVDTTQLHMGMYRTPPM